MVQCAVFDPLKESKKSDTLAISNCLETYLHLFSSVQPEKAFITDYHLAYGFDNDFRTLQVSQRLGNEKKKITDFFSSDQWIRREI